MKYFVLSCILILVTAPPANYYLDDAIGNMRIMNHADEDYGLIIGL